MKRTTISLAIVLGLTSLFGAGCFSRTVVDISSTSQPGVILMESVDATDYLFWTDRKFRFWRCTQQPGQDAMYCQSDCGAESDLECPFAVVRY